MRPEELVLYGMSIASRPSGDRSANIEASIEAFTSALDQIPASRRFPRAFAEYQLAMSRQERLAGSAEENRAAAAEGYLRGVKLLEGLRTQEARDLLGQTLGNLAHLAVAGNDVETAIAYAERSLLYLEKSINPRAWGVSQQNLGSMYLLRSTADRAADLALSIAAFDAALEVRRPDGPEPALHRRTVVSRQQAVAMLARLGTAPGAAPGPGIELLEALAAEPSGDIVQDRQLHLHLGLAYRRLADHDGVDRMTRLEARDRALRHFERLRELSADDTDERRARVDTLVAIGRGEQSERDPVGATEEFITRTEASLTGIATVLEPEDVARINARLAAAYTRRLAGDRGDNLRSAIGAYERALAALAGTTGGSGGARGIRRRRRRPQPPGGRRARPPLRAGVPGDAAPLAPAAGHARLSRVTARPSAGYADRAARAPGAVTARRFAGPGRRRGAARCRGWSRSSWCRSARHG
ncbi:tetratricopeptide (TPR) repeat protein [Allocatelliglobosispora scoriae]|uniref:Tetratricopeptide (TPR) repeat protein n=1 Tax=Allocatelliglobosispora scoriae TaxID=643052 RepID=A0A841BZL3_9ACTN|nr:hypothetical protein [Allocatelliglobosispora scoriae]MBB5873574.1 tetratricopeptide (TPR) repeat protein [Allocatelliglobosispora scoriae]